MGAIDDKIPKTGRIGRFAKILKNEVSKELFLKVLKDSDRYNSFNPSKKAEWWKNTVIRMENELGTQKTKEIMKSCGRKCCGSGHRKTVRKKPETPLIMQFSILYLQEVISPFAKRRVTG